MGKVIKATKKDFADLLDAVDRVPSSKAASDIAKHISFRRSLKKALKGYIEGRADLVREFEKAKKENAKSTLAIDQQIAQGVTEEIMEQLTNEKKAIETKLNEVLADVNSKLAELVERISVEKCAVTFDHEAFLFEDKVIRDNVTLIFGYGEKNEKLNNDKVEVIFDLLDSAQSPPN